jgi:hypothetical protein
MLASPAMPHRFRNRLALIGALIFAASGTVAATGGAALEIVVAVGDDGTPLEAWLEALRGLRPAAEVAAAAAARRPLTSDERAWETLIRSRRDAWSARRAELAEPFEPIEAPGEIRILLGNVGGEDAFTPDSRTIGFDLARLQREYGDAGLAENGERIDRFFAHEYTHLLQKAWLTAHPQVTGSPYARAEMGMWLEGLGNYYSLSARWRTVGGVESPQARSTLDELEPVLVARLSALACASPEEEARLTADLSMGPFTKKWGALPVALWLEAEASAAPAALARFVQAGPAAVRDLARRHLPPELFAELERARQRSSGCERGGAPGAATAPP